MYMNTTPTAFTILEYNLQPRCTDIWNEIHLLQETVISFVSKYLFFIYISDSQCKLQFIFTTIYKIVRTTSYAL